MTIAVLKAAITKEQMERQLMASGLRYTEATVYNQPAEAQLYLKAEQERLERTNLDETQPFLPFR